MSWTSSFRLSRLRFRIVLALSLLLICLVYLLPPTAYFREYEQNLVHEANRTNSSTDTTTANAATNTLSSGPLALPEVYRPALLEPALEGACANRYGANYLRSFRKTATNYCDAESTATLTCFSNTLGDTRTDSFCIGLPALLESSHRKIIMDCTLQDWDKQNTQAVPKLQDFPSYWYNTGPSVIFSNFIQLQRIHEPAMVVPDSPTTFSFLIQREGAYNLWHSIMQIMALTLSLDVLRISVDPTTGEPMFRDQDIDNAQVVILDDFEDGPFFDLWTMDTKRSPLRFDEAAAQGLSTKIVVPLPGASNPFWEGDWIDLPCGKSELLRTFSRRVLQFYNLLPTDDAPKPRTSLTLTLIDRKEKRQLLDQDAHFAKLTAKYPNIKTQLIDLAALPLREQVTLIHETDILVGMHGAGLTHGMFLPPNSTVVEIQPAGLKHKGFKNMSRFLGHRYFVRNGDKHHSQNDNGDWHDADVYISEEHFLALMDEAIAAAVK